MQVILLLALALAAIYGVWRLLRPVFRTKQIEFAEFLNDVVHECRKLLKARAADNVGGVDIVRPLSPFQLAKELDGTRDLIGAARFFLKHGCVFSWKTLSAENPDNIPIVRERTLELLLRADLVVLIADHQKSVDQLEKSSSSAQSIARLRRAQEDHFAKQLAIYKTFIGNGKNFAMFRGELETVKDGPSTPNFIRLPERREAT